MDNKEIWDISGELRNEYDNDQLMSVWCFSDSLINNFIGLCKIYLILIKGINCVGLVMYWIYWTKHNKVCEHQWWHNQHLIKPEDMHLIYSCTSQCDKITTWKGKL